MTASKTSSRLGLQMDNALLITQRIAVASGSCPLSVVYQNNWLTLAPGPPGRATAPTLLFNPALRILCPLRRSGSSRPTEGHQDRSRRSECPAAGMVFLHGRQTER